MSAWNKGALLSLRADLKMHVIMDGGLADKLEKMAGGFLDDREAVRVRQERTNMEQMDKLIQFLLGKSNEDFATFLKMLRQSNNGAWAEKLAKTAKQMKQNEGMYSEKGNQLATLAGHQYYHAIDAMNPACPVCVCEHV